MDAATRSILADIQNSIIKSIRADVTQNKRIGNDQIQALSTIVIALELHDIRINTEVIANRVGDVDFGS